jgi:hypothetical protein
MVVGTTQLKLRLRGGVFGGQQNTAALFDKLSGLIKVRCARGSSFPSSIPSSVLNLANNTVCCADVSRSEMTMLAGYTGKEPIKTVLARFLARTWEFFHLGLVSS